LPKNYSFIESALVLNLETRQDLNKIPFRPSHFSLHGDTFQFILEYLDEYEDLPKQELLLEKFPDLDKDSVGTNLDYSINEFRNQILFREARDVIRNNQGVIETEPRVFINNVISGLSDVDIDFSEDIIAYNDGSSNRLEEYKQRKENRNQMKIRGITTPFKSINNTGTGFIPGELISIFARPSVGKTWMGVLVAAIAASKNHRIVFVTPEMTNDEVSYRIDVVLGRLEGYNFSHYGLTRGQGVNEDEYKSFLNSSNARNLLMADQTGRGRMSIGKVATLVRKYKPDMLVIDGIHLLDHEGHTQMWEKAYNLFYDLKDLCTAHKIVGFVTTQAKKEAAENFFTAPTTNQVVFGDGLMQASDIVFSMCPVRNEQMQRRVQLQKYRGAPPPFESTKLDWDVDSGKIMEIL